MFFLAKLILASDSRYLNSVRNGPSINRNPMVVFLTEEDHLNVSAENDFEGQK